MRGVKYKINYLQEMKKYKKNETTLQEQENTMIFNARSYTRKFQLILCFNIDLKELKDSAIFASWGRLSQCKAPL
jgi:hypothetical protein